MGSVPRGWGTPTMAGPRGCGEWLQLSKGERRGRMPPVTARGGPDGSAKSFPGAVLGGVGAYLFQIAGIGEALAPPLPRPAVGQADLPVLQQ